VAAVSRHTRFGVPISVFGVAPHREYLRNRTPIKDSQVINPTPDKDSQVINLTRTKDSLDINQDQVIRFTTRRGFGGRFSIQIKDSLVTNRDRTKDSQVINPTLDKDSQVINPTRTKDSQVVNRDLIKDSQVINPILVFRSSTRLIQQRDRAFRQHRS